MCRERTSKLYKPNKGWYDNLGELVVEWYRQNGVAWFEVWGKLIQRIKVTPTAIEGRK